MDTILKVEGINVYYGAIHAIKDISFEVNRGEIVTLIGANGAGKTTTLQTISGLLRSRTGSITFQGTTSPTSGRTSWWPGPGSGPRGTACLPADVGAGEFGDGGLHPVSRRGAQGPGDGL